MQNSQRTADIIKALAKSNGISVSKLLEDCGLNKNALYTMQTGGYYPRVEALIKIADYFNCSVDYLLDRTENPVIEQLQNELAQKNRIIEQIKNLICNEKVIKNS